MTDLIPTGRDPNTGQFTSGNRFWEARSSHGRNPKFETADILEDAIRQYFEWNEDNPLYESKLVSFQGQSKVEILPRMRAMTVGAMCMFIGIDHSTWIDWKESRPDFSEVISWAEQVIYSQKFEGASADLLNPNIIARDLGLADKKDHTTNGKDMPAPLDLSNLSSEALAEIVAARDAAKQD